jgi:hypothetical protein
MRDSVYQYVSQLELGHPRFPRKEDLLWYFMFICTTILVGGPLRFLTRPSLFFIQAPQISARIVLELPTIAVPGIEEDCPCASAGPSFAYLKRVSPGRGHGGMSLMDDSCNSLCLLGWLSCSLHLSAQSHML